MLAIFGSLTVVICVIGGFIMMGGYIEILIQPVEFIIIIDVSISAFIIANPRNVIKASFQVRDGLIESTTSQQGKLPRIAHAALIYFQTGTNGGHARCA